MGDGSVPFGQPKQGATMGECAVDGCDADPVIGVNIEAIEGRRLGCAIASCVEHLEENLSSAARAVLIVNRIVDAEDNDELDLLAQLAEHEVDEGIRIRCHGGPLDGRLLDRPPAIAAAVDEFARRVPDGSIVDPVPESIMLRPVGNDGESTGSYVATPTELDPDGAWRAVWQEDEAA